METWIQRIMEDFGYIGVFLLIMLENLFPPIPSEVILTFGGFMTTFTDLTVTGVIIASTLGSVAGAIILYGIGLLLDVERLVKIVDKYGHILRLTRNDIYKADAWFDRYGFWTVFFCRFIPLIRSLISIPAGMSNMKFWLFILLTTLGTLIWNTVLVHVGATVGENWEKIVEVMDVYSNIAYAVIAVVFIWFVVRFIRKKKLFKRK
ncbi:MULTISPECIES: DedA family protein [Ureibacillus]|jgi:membrane protein DedA with SNARE-associated domain|uniref:Membrane protein DedA with SNARE-associated domain n=1 Tax=Ureibacillus thermosphaericus TaxID=51173 RepID=A0A840PR96_URETH|nr:DedA family protein [Ureibacillus thermosphaericus]MBB5148420.1 membrane protein DedA with SNARE-associated domain [Ureibacillus thermosphaericus]NKZ31248.1 DedA family protein [Ureibacillus thermosphaericus]